MRKNLSFFFLFLILSLSCCEVIKLAKNRGRTVSPQNVALQIEFLGPCDKFNTLDTISVSQFTNQGCLPILTTAGNHDKNDLNAYILCTNIDESRSLVTIVEVYPGANDSNPPPPFIVSLVPKRPFRVLNGATYKRRPSCQVTKDFCTENHSMVTKCKENEVVMKHKYVMSNDLIYIIPKGYSTVSCYPSTNTCCEYVAPNYEGGICQEGTIQNPNRLLNFDFDDDGDNKKHH
eukprot:TRINITY_DN15074_c0_g1_i1.p1 TRINITY_DN15074_c0_g1~~TRINITY_DN15074_c0_g1_i1.p1  ORF type:complete len:233 (-),score=21.01 TRINITY_DN15074_c0_g1_i1:62-760(-)